MTTEDVIDAYKGCAFYIVVTNFGSNGAVLLGHQRVVEAASVKQEIVQIIEECFWCPAFGKGSKDDRSMNSIQYKPAADSLEEMTIRKTMEDKEKQFLKKNWKEDVQMPDKFKDHPLAFFIMLEELESIWDGSFGRINVSKHGFNERNNTVRPVHSSPYWGRTTTRRLAGVETCSMIIVKVINPTTIKTAALVLLIRRRITLLSFAPSIVS